MREVGRKYNIRPFKREGPDFMEPNVLFVRETTGDDGDLLWSYGTRDRRFSGASYDHRRPHRIAKRHNLVVHYVMDQRGWS